MHCTVSTWGEFARRWDGVLNFLMTGECVPFSFEMPPVDRIIEEMRREPATNILSGAKGTTLLSNSIREEFCKLSITEAMGRPFAIANYRLSVFDVPGKFLHGFEQRVMDPWRKALTAQGFTFERCYPIVFLGGPGYATNYHMDFSHVLAWQVHGTKRFCGLTQPDRWAPREMRVTYRPAALVMPEEIKPEDSLCYEMKPGAVLWNCLLTPHWVEASNEVAMSINISHGGLRYRGKLCPHEQELEDFRAKHPEIAPGKVQGKY